MAKEKTKFKNHNAPLEERLSYLVNELSLEEKISLLSTTQSAIPRLGIDEYHIGGEAAHGVVDRNGGKATVFPQPIGLSSTWNNELLKQVGNVIGDEARIFYELQDKKTGLTLWAPTIDMERDPRWGRTEEAYGEDPYLTGKLSTKLIKGMQGDDDFYVKMVAAPKHFYGNNNEYGREYISNSIDPRNRHEYYLKAFEPAFIDGKALSMMTAYNGINGIPCMQIHEIKDVVKDQWKMDGFIVSDGGALSLNIDSYHYYDSHAEALADALKKGIDCFVDTKILVESAAHEALEKNLISEDDITNAIRNILKVRFRLGHFDEDSSANPYNNVDFNKMCSVEHAQVALEATKESIVLLKNELKTLPLKEDEIKKIAVIGPTADVIYKDWYTGTSSYRITPLQGLRQRFKNAEINFVNGNDKIAIKSVRNNEYLGVGSENKINVKHSTIGQKEMFEIEEWGWNGNLLKSESNNKYVSQQEDALTFDADKEEVFSWFVREKIAFQRLNHSEQRFHLFTWKGDSLAVSEDKSLIASNKPDVFEKKILSSGIDEAVEIARNSDVAIVFVGNNPMLNGRETEDRPDIVLPKHQQKLVEAVFEVNRNTVVVVIGSYPFAMNWIDKHIPAVLYSAHGSQMLGEGLASILSGDDVPSGRLSMTWYKDGQQLPSIFDYDIIKGNRTYMYFDDEVLYPFGHGLSYADFNYSCLKVNTSILNKNNPITVSVDIKNTSDMEASEVVQLYATVKESSVKRPRIQLVDFEKIKLAPEERRTIHLVVKPEQLFIWDVNREAFCLENGRCILSVGSSSESIRSTIEIEVEGDEIMARSLDKPTKAENYDDYEHVVLHKGENNLNCVTNQSNGWICFKNVKLGSKNQIHLRANTDGMAGGIFIKLDHKDSDTIVEQKIESEFPGQWNDYEMYVEAEKGLHDVFVYFKGSVSLNTIQINYIFGENDED